MKEIGNWYYQIWLHRGHGNTVSALDIYKTEGQATDSANSRNAMARHDNRPDLPMKDFFFVRPIAKEDLPYGGSKYDSYLDDDKREFMKDYRGELLPYAQDMVASMLRSLNELDSASHFRLYENGGWHVGYKQQYRPFRYIECTAIYSGVERIILEVAFNCGKYRCASFVGAFEDEKELRNWLAQSHDAAKMCEEKLIEIRCDRFVKYIFD